MAFLNLDLDYFDHPKTVRLVGLLGRGADLLPIRLWCYCGKYHAENGHLTGYSPEEIETAVKWWGQSGRAVEALVKTKFLDKRENGYHVHDWDQINGHISALKERAQAAAKARWDKYRADQDAQAMLKHSLGNAPGNAPTIPSSPSLPPSIDPPARVGGIPVTSREAFAQGQAATAGPTQEDEARARKVLELYPLRAKKDGRSLKRTIHDQSVLVAKIVRHREFAWEEAADLMKHNHTPPDMARWLDAQPDPVELATNRRLAAEPEPPAHGKRDHHQAVGGRKRVPLG